MPYLEDIDSGKTLSGNCLGHTFQTRFPIQQAGASESTAFQRNHSPVKTVGRVHLIQDVFLDGETQTLQLAHLQVEHMSDQDDQHNN